MIAVSSLLLDHNAAGLLTRPLSAAQTMTALLPELPETVYRYSPMFLVALVGHALARPTRWSTWSFFHVESTQFLAYIYLVPCSALCSWLCQSASREFLFICCCKLIFLLLHFSSFPIHRSYALVCSCVDVDVKLTDTHWACPLGSNKLPS